MYVAAQKNSLAAFREDVQRFIEHYDPVTTGMGSLLVCGYCMGILGQSPWEALQLAGFSTVMGMVANEVLFLSNDDPQQPLE